MSRLTPAADPAVADGLTIRPIDLGSDADLDAINRINAADEELAFGASTAPTVEQTRADAANTTYWRQHRLLAERDADGHPEAVGTGWIGLPLAENTDQAMVAPVVHPDHRGQGVGTALLTGLAQIARDAGRTMLSAWGAVPLDGDVDDPDLPANRLAVRFGMSRKNVAVTRVLDLPVDPNLLDRLWARAEPHLDGYRILSWTDRTPAEHLEAYGVLLRQLELDEPDEDVVHEAPEYTPERIRIAEDRKARKGLRSLVAVALAPDGSFAGNSVVEFHGGAATTLGFQENTLVMPDHRGHRLGYALKVTTHRMLASHAPRLRRLATWNSHVNPWMIQINEDLGYRAIGREVTYQG
ncbi:GNAT family N-acetyltransferase [Ruania zhangjianzhongii]|uniref:GNAT family N-acetyltransferase n=1 Tax=Ruania zhangjianzhongii TaxID=2603206 RepID=UPI0011C8E491|nr:GNAT family N-acetyltransferase [Ruania zhangjianzhongii]